MKRLTMNKMINYLFFGDSRKTAYFPWVYRAV